MQNGAEHFTAMLRDPRLVRCKIVQRIQAFHHAAWLKFWTEHLPNKSSFKLFERNGCHGAIGSALEPSMSSLFHL